MQEMEQDQWIAKTHIRCGSISKIDGHRGRAKVIGVMPGETDDPLQFLH
jgi:hypothetical protein